MRRRDIIAGAVATPLLTAVAGGASMPAGTVDKAPDNEAYWGTIAAQYDVTREVIQWENGNWGIMARPVMAAYHRQVERVNRENSYYARRGMVADMAAVRARVATELGVSAEEIILTRNATEALKTLIGNYNRLRPGDSVLYADLDYDATQASMRSLARLRGVTVRRVGLPEPATYQGVIDAYAAAFDADPKIRLVLLTHLSHRTGLVIPLREIVALARSRGIDAIVDAAHSWGQLDFDFAAQGVEFAGFNLHKWFGTPLGVGLMYIRKDRQDAIDPDMANEPGPGIDARLHTGVVDYAAALTVPAAFDFQGAIGTGPREGRLRYLRDRWVKQVRGLDGIDVLSPDDPRMHVGTTSFRIRGLTSAADNIAVAKALLDQHRIFTVHRTEVAKGCCVRATPALFVTPEQCDALAAALADLVPKMRR
nr:aminotransferase class V-fold PLP-dependent enzyme [Sphingobium nicotianae]